MDHRYPLCALARGRWAVAWAPFQTIQAVATIHAALDAGMTFIDTAEGYHTSESVIGKALRGRRQEAFLATKLSGDHSPEHIVSGIENSLRSLGTDYVDLYQLHSPRPEWPIEDTMARLLKLREQGKIRHIGVSNFSGEQHRAAASHGPVSSSQPRYSMLFREAEQEVLPACLELGIGVIAHSPLAKGILTGKYRPGHRFPGDDERSDHFVFREGGLEGAVGSCARATGLGGRSRTRHRATGDRMDAGPSGDGFVHRRGEDAGSGVAQRKRGRLAPERGGDGGAT